MCQMACFIWNLFFSFTDNSLNNSVSMTFNAKRIEMEIFF